MNKGLCDNCGNQFHSLVADNVMTPNGKVRTWLCADCFRNTVTITICKDCDGLFGNRTDSDICGDCAEGKE